MDHRTHTAEDETPAGRLGHAERAKLALFAALDRLQDADASAHDAMTEATVRLLTDRLRP